MSEDLATRVQRATQAGLPRVPRPYEAVAHGLGVTEAEVLQALRAMLADGRARRIGVVPNHYAIGYVANGMSVWDVDDDAVATLGSQVGALGFVSHCYRRPRRLEREDASSHNRTSHLISPAPRRRPVAGHRGAAGGRPLIVAERHRAYPQRGGRGHRPRR